MPYDTPFVRFQKATEITVTDDPTAQPITVLDTSPPTATSPTEGLPANATTGRFYTFRSQPTTLYTIGPDGVWRAILLVQVV